MAAKKKPAKKAPAKKAPATKGPAKKAPATKAPRAKKAPAKKAPAKKAPATKAPAEKAPAKKASPPASAAMKAPTAKAPETKAPVDAAPPPPATEEQGGLAVKPGDVAPDFTIPGDDDRPFSLRDFRGKKVVLYFYPRDNTPGCTIEAQEFSELHHEFAARNAVILGVSTDGTASHRKFKHTCELEIPLLADTERVVHGLYGTWGKKNMYGKIVEGTIRSTFVIGEDGRVERVWPKVKVQDHAVEVLNSLSP